MFWSKVVVIIFLYLNSSRQYTMGRNWSKTVLDNLLEQKFHFNHWNKKTKVISLTWLIFVFVWLSMAPYLLNEWAYLNSVIFFNGNLIECAMFQENFGNEGWKLHLFIKILTFVQNISLKNDIDFHYIIRRISQNIPFWIKKLLKIVCFCPFVIILSYYK